MRLRLTFNSIPASHLMMLGHEVNFPVDVVFGVFYVSTEPAKPYTTEQ